MRELVRFVTLLTAITGSHAAAADTALHDAVMTPHSAMGGGGMIRVDTRAGANGEGVIHTVDLEERVVNLTHGPIPSLGWPAMTMDLPVAEGVDLSRVQPGDKVRFRVVLGADQVYRITTVDATP